jgi:pilus assembly protein CpaE
VILECRQSTVDWGLETDLVSVTIVDSVDSELDGLLRQAGMQVTHLDLAGLVALTAPSTRQPDVVVLDVRGKGSIPSVVSTLKRQHPQTAIVMIAPALEAGLLVEAMRAGVNEVVADPVTQADLEQAIQRVVNQRQPAGLGRVFAIVGAKGGVGATTVAVNIASVLGPAGKPGRTLLMDLHQAGGDAALFLGAEPRFSILDALENTHRLDATFLRSLVTPVAPGVDLLASPERAVTTHADTATNRAVIDFMAATYRFIVLDLPRSDVAALDALDLADTIIVVANQELATVRRAARLSAALRQRYGRDKVAVVLSRSDRHAEIAGADVERVIAMPVAHVFPSDYRTALQALNRGRPLALGNHNALSGSLKRFALQLAGVRPDRDASPRAGLLGRLTQRGA